MFRPALIIFATSAAAFASGCDTAGRHLFIAHNTVVGVDAAVNTDQTRGHLLIGYDRQFVAYIPRSVRDDGSSPGDGANVAKTSGSVSERRDAMTAIACSQVAVDGIYLTQFTEYLATGRAAELYAKALKAHPGSQLYECLNTPAKPSE